jgi:multidrug efflux pump subunit AcrA (membrane-fusion protein)
MKLRPWFLISLVGPVLLFAGCGKKTSAEADHDHSEHAGEEGGGEGGVTFKEGRGLQLSPEVIKALNLRTTEAEERSLAAELNVIAQVFAVTPRVLASARLTEEQAGALEKSSFTGAKLMRIDRSTVAATRLVDLVFELDASPQHQIGDFVTLALAVEPATVLSVPRSAVLDGATGSFVYVVNSGAYLRTPVKVGARSADFIEISDGLYTGDIVVVTPVDQLWLAELRLTKGGGHSH